MSENEQGGVHVYPTSAELADAAARLVVQLAQQAVAAQGRFSIALSGGSTPRALYTRLASPPLCDALDWSRVHVFWSDERHVPLDDPESCYRMARETLLDRVPVPGANIYPAPTEGRTPEQAARAYTQTIQERLGGSLPRFDLILLGMGPDGHTASLFPGAPAVTAPSEALVVPVFDAPKPPPTRLSFSYHLINAAAHVLFLVAGADKAATLQQVLLGTYEPARLPAQGVHPADGVLTWMVDRAAAQELAD
jgi:6-phosphogluconolactonase